MSVEAGSRPDGAIRHETVPARWGPGSILSIALCLAAFAALCLSSGLWYLFPVPLVVFAWRWLTGRGTSALRAFHAVPADPVAHARLLHHTGVASDGLGLVMPDVYVSPVPVLNAFAISDRRSAAICVSQLTIDTLQDDELGAVVAHEVGHIKNRDSAFMVFFDAARWSLTALVAVFAAVFVLAVAVLGAFTRSARGVTGMAAAVAAGLTTAGAAAAYLLVMAGQRSREYMADRLAAQVHPDPSALGRALVRMQSADRQWRVGDIPASVAALCIVQPFAAGWAATLVSSHPSPDRRIRRLEKLVGADLAAQSNAEAARRDWRDRRDALEAEVSFARAAQPAPVDGPVPFAPAGSERIWAVLPARMVRPRTRQGRLLLEVADHGTCYVTTTRAVFSSPTGRTEWRWDKLHAHGWERGVAGGDAVVMEVTNRQKPSGLQFSLEDAREAQVMLELALADARGTRQDYVTRLERGLSSHDEKQPAT